MDQREPRTLVIPDKLTLKQLTDSGLRDVILREYEHIVLPSDFESRFQEGIDEHSPGNLRAPNGNGTLGALLNRISEERGGGSSGQQVLQDMSQKERDQTYTAALAQTDWFGPNPTVLGLSDEHTRAIAGLQGDVPMSLDTQHGVEEIPNGRVRNLSSTKSLITSLYTDGAIQEHDMNVGVQNIDRGQLKRDNGNIFGRTLKKGIKKMSGGVEDEWKELVTEQGKQPSYLETQGKKRGVNLDR
jgi:hypothetical protein